MGTKKQNRAYRNKTKTNRTYKDRLFRMIFESKKDLLELYNAVNHTDYTDEKALVINTLSDAVYVGVKNDLSFLIGGTMNLYEEQSSYNPNMPVRGLLYFARLYEGYLEEQGLNIYSSTLQQLPMPQYVVFYNGLKGEPDYQILSLKDAFILEESGGEACLECTAIMMNINYGHNKELLQRCRKLKEYAIFVDKVRRCLEEKKDIGPAVDHAVMECINGDILREFLVKHRGEVKGMILTSFDKEKYEQMIRKEEKDLGREEGRAEGRTEGRAEGEKATSHRYNQLILKLAAEGKSDRLAEAAEHPLIMEQLFQEFGL